MKEVIELLKKGWIKGAEARDKDGFNIPFDNSNAFSFCLTGAIHRIYGKKQHYKGCHCYIFNQYVYEHTKFTKTFAFNDSPNTTLEDVIALCEQAEKDNVFG